MQILYDQGISPLPKDQCQLLQELAERVATIHPVEGPVQLILIGDAYMQNLNATYRGKDHTTDVLSFSLEVQDSDVPDLDAVGGEIYISLERTRVQAAQQAVTLVEELARLLVHGLLHLAGYDHDTPEKLHLMEQKTDILLQDAGLLAGMRQ